MDIALVFTSKHGTTRKIVRYIQSLLNNNEVSIFDLNKNSKPNLTHFNTIIVGTSIHAGTIPHNMQKFLFKNRNLLLSKQLAVFMCGMLEDKQEQLFEQNFSAELRNHSVCNGLFGGEFIFEEMNFIERFMVKKIAKVNHSVSSIKYDQIDEFCSHF